MAWIVWILSSLAAFAVLGFIGIFIGLLFRKMGADVDSIVDSLNFGELLAYILMPIAPFISFVLVVKYMIVRKVKARVKQQIHQRYQKLLEEKGIQLEDSDV